MNYSVKLVNQVSAKNLGRRAKGFDAVLARYILFQDVTGGMQKVSAEEYYSRKLRSNWKN